MLPSRIFFDDMFEENERHPQMSCDIYEQNGIYIVEVDVPGFRKSDIKLEFNKGSLTIIAEHRKEEIDHSKKYIHRERRMYGKLERTIYLGEVDEDKINASFEDGILRIEAPKKTDDNRKKYIDIR